MESKKTSKADLNEKRGTFFVLGIILALSLLFVSLEYTSKEFDSFLEDEYLRSAGVFDPGTFFICVAKRKADFSIQ